MSELDVAPNVLVVIGTGGMGLVDAVIHTAGVSPVMATA